MSCHRLVLNAAAALATLLPVGSAAIAADMLEHPRCPLDRPQYIIELQPGMTKIVSPDRLVQAIVIGNPNIADASVINLHEIAITGKGPGLTNFILFDQSGCAISNANIQVVDANAFIAGNHVRERHEIRVVSMWRGPSAQKDTEDLPKDRRYLCAQQGCGAIRVDEPESLNPPGNTSAAVSPTNKSIITYSSPQTPAPQEGK
jgi:Pilus formation protein N terminal region